MQLRISSGEYRNVKINIPESASPVRDRVKLAVFSIISEKLENAKCLDLYAGSGNLGIEALSRGAKHCTFIEDHPMAIKAIMENIQSIQEKFETTFTYVIKREDTIKYVTNTTEYYDIVFMDPPYDLQTRHIVKHMHEVLNPDGIIVFFHAKDYEYNPEELNPDIKVVDSRTYGITKVDFITKR